jgi:ribose transport system substrate-binding protein
MVTKFQRVNSDAHATRTQWHARGLAVLAAVLFLLTAAGCGGGKADTASSDGGSSTPTSKHAGAAGAPIAVDKMPTEPFDPNVAPGQKPDAPRRIAWSLPAGGELLTTLDKAIRQAAESRGIEYISAQADGDSTKQFQQTQDFLGRGIGALVIVDAAPPALAPLQQQAIERGIPVFCGPFFPCTSQLTADQYAAGKAQGEQVVKWVKANLGGKAKIVYFNQDNSPSIRPRDRGAREVFKAAGPGLEVVADVTIRQVSADEGFRLTNTVLQQHPDVDVWVGPDSNMMGTLSALEAAGKADDSAIFGREGDAQALAEVAKGGPYKGTLAYPLTVIAYGWGKYAADWFDGKSIPEVLNGRYVEINSKADVEAWRKVIADPQSTFEENEKTHRYFTPLGNTSYEQHRYLTSAAEATG